MRNNKLIVKTASKSYPIYFSKNILFRTGKLISKNLPKVKKVCVICDNKLPKYLVGGLYKSLKKYNVIICKLTANEKNKNIKVAQKIIERLLKEDFNRTDCIIALGGGMIGDISAFISNLTKRGIKFINIPTTLLAQVDASIGGKTGINSNQGKNLIGTYYQPDFVLSDVSTLKTLPQREVISGYGEILKHALILDKKFFLWLNKYGKKILKNKDSFYLQEAIIKSCKIKSKIVEMDEKEINLRMILNFGHTFAHGFERAKNYSRKINHGEAVLLGMMIASELSFKKKILKEKDFSKIKNHYYDLGLPHKIKKIFKKNEMKKITHFMTKDKKNSNKKINLILLNKIGKTTKPQKYLMEANKVKNFLESYYQ
jgi:3-dehydroquinate synthase/shikimate kinase/3-dehydroquinate synthase|tara:strand:+ start:137 stop:1249 length:1113 start_codon:yes stop_codon:yes gene_type:complete